jgi:hypothetical protein
LATIESVDLPEGSVATWNFGSNSFIRETGTIAGFSCFPFIGATVKGETLMKRIALLIAASAAIAVAAPAFAEEVGVGVGPVGVTVGSSPDHVVREREVIRERDHRPADKVIIKKERERDPTVVEKKTIIHRD